MLIRGGFGVSTTVEIPKPSSRILTEITEATTKTPTAPVITLVTPVFPTTPRLPTAEEVAAAVAKLVKETREATEREIAAKKKIPGWAWGLGAAALVGGIFAVTRRRRRPA